MTRALTPAVYAPDATGVPALWPWVAAPPVRERCATRGCTERPRKPAIGDAPAAIVLCGACRVAAGYDAPTASGVPCAARGCHGRARPMRRGQRLDLAPYCAPCRHRGHLAVGRGIATVATVGAYVAAGRVGTRAL